MLTTGVVNTINVFRNGEQVDVFQLQQREEKAYENWKESMKHRKEDEFDLRLKKERAKKQKKLEKEYQEQLDAQKATDDALNEERKALLEEMQKDYSQMNDKMEQINKMIADLQVQAESSKSARERYEQENGITDGAERMQKALEEARARLAQ